MNIAELLQTLVLAGVMALVFVCMGKVLWTLVFARLYAKLASRRRPSIAGIWRGEGTTHFGRAYEEELRLQQVGRQVKGIARYVLPSADDDPEIRREYKVSGILKNGHFVGYYWNADRRQSGVGSFMYKIVRKDGACRAEGKFIDVTSGESVVQDADLWQVG